MKKMIKIKEDVRSGDIILEKGYKITEGRGTPVLPLGIVNTTTGKSKIFNIYDTWNDSGMIAEVWLNLNSGKKVLAFSSGSLTRQSGERKTFIHDQTSRPLFNGEYLTEYALEDLSTRMTGSFRGFVYK